jgi:hypothetical protein
MSSAQQGNKTILILPGNWTSHAAGAELSLLSSDSIENGAASNWWRLSSHDKNKITFRLSESANASSVFAIYSTVANPTFDYKISVNSSEYSGTIVPVRSSNADWFVNWTDIREGALSAFVPQGWKADLQIVRPYNSMTGFVFFVRGEGNALAYVFYPFMPLHIMPEDQVCKALGRCNGMTSTEMTQKSLFGNAPVAISSQKAPAQYFESELLPLLRASLDGYTVQSASPLFALQYDKENKPGSKFAEGLEVDYSFSVQEKKITGKSAVVIANHTMHESGFWNGVVIGVESSEASFERDFRLAAVTLLTLRINDGWMSKEQAVLDQGATLTSPALRNITAIIANTTLSDFDSVISTIAHALVRTQDDMRIGAYIDSATGEEIHLPLHESAQNWYLDDQKLLGRKIGRNIMNATTIEPLHR